MARRGFGAQWLDGITGINWQFVKKGKKQFLHRDGRATSNAGEGTAYFFRALRRAYSLKVPAGCDYALFWCAQTKLPKPLEYRQGSRSRSPSGGVWAFFQRRRWTNGRRPAASGTRRATIGRSVCRVATALQRLITRSQVGRQSACTQDQNRLTSASARPFPETNGKMLSAAVKCSSKEVPFLMSRLLQKCCTWEGLDALAVEEQLIGCHLSPIEGGASCGGGMFSLSGDLCVNHIFTLLLRDCDARHQVWDQSCLEMCESLSQWTCGHRVRGADGWCDNLGPQ